MIRHYTLEIRNGTEPSFDYSFSEETDAEGLSRANSVLTSSKVCAAASGATLFNETDNTVVALWEITQTIKLVPAHTG